MQITVTFNNLDEVREFTEKIMVGGVSVAQPEKVIAEVEAPASTTPTVSPVQTAAPTAVPTGIPTSAQPVISVPTSAPSVSAPAVPVTSVPTSTVAYTPDDLARAAMALMDSGKQQELIALLGQFGVVAIPELRPEQYGAFATALRGMGAQI